MASPSPAPEHALLAAVDLGSNSFRLTIGRIESTPHGWQIRAIDGFKESVRLAAGLSANRDLDASALERGVATLRRFGERLRSLPPGRVRAVATSTLRLARNAAQFLAAGQEALGFPIEVIAGREEARLIYAGASHDLPADGLSRLVVDIGGGSTECIVGRDHDVHALESANIGCVGLTRDFFASGEIRRDRYQAAVYHARDALARTRLELGGVRWDYAVGTSGTARALTQLAQSIGFEHLDLRAIEALERALVKAGHCDNLDMPALRSDRRGVIAGGLAAMRAVFDELGVSALRYCDAALREGVLYELMGRQSGVDMREVSVARMQTRHGVDEAHGRRIAVSALGMFTQCLCGSDGTADELKSMLRHAARLCEVGLSVSHDNYHRHSAYLVENSDMPGFSATEQAQIALLVLGHTGGLRKLRGRLPSSLMPLALLSLRVAVILHRRREASAIPTPALFAERGRVRIELPSRWTVEHPLTDHLLVEEVELWNEARLLEAVDYVRT